LVKAFSQKHKPVPFKIRVILASLLYKKYSKVFIAAKVILQL